MNILDELVHHGPFPPTWSKTALTWRKGEKILQVTNQLEITLQHDDQTFRFCITGDDFFYRDSMRPLSHWLCSEKATEPMRYSPIIFEQGESHEWIGRNRIVVVTTYGVGRDTIALFSRDGRGEYLVLPTPFPRAYALGKFLAQ